MSNDLPKIALVPTGGTISSQGRDPLDLFDYGGTGQRYDGAGLLQFFPEISEIADVQVFPFKGVSSTAITPSDWLHLAEKIHEVSGGDAFEGIVVTHGTASLEETAYFLHLTLKTALPVVLVGAQRPPTGLSSDAGANLLNAVRLAGASSVRGLGVFVLLNDEVQSARDVTKTSNYRLHAFQTRDLGALGFVDPDGTVAIYRHPTRRHAPDTEFEIGAATDLPRVDIVYAYAGADEGPIEAIIERCRPDGLVVAGLPAGSPTPAQRRALEAAVAKGIHVFQSSRSGSGRVLPRRAIVDPGFVPTDNLNPQKARVLAMLALTVTRDRDELMRIFATY